MVTVHVFVTAAHANRLPPPPPWSIRSSENFFEVRGLGIEQNEVEWYFDSLLGGVTGSCGIGCTGTEEALYRWMTALTTKTPNRTRLTDPQAALNVLADDFSFTSPVGFEYGSLTKKEYILWGLTNLNPTFDIRGPLVFRKTADGKQAAFVFEWTYGEGPYTQGMTRFRINDENKIVSYSEYFTFNYGYGISDTTGTKEALDSQAMAKLYAEKMSMKRIGSDSVISPMLNEWFALWDEDGSIAMEFPVGHAPMTSRAQFDALLQAFPTFTVSSRMVRVSESDRDVAMLLDFEVEGRNFTGITFLTFGNSTNQNQEQERLHCPSPSDDDGLLVYSGIVTLCVGSMFCLISFIYVSHMSRARKSQVPPWEGYQAAGAKGTLGNDVGTIHHHVMREFPWEIRNTSISDMGSCKV